MAKFVKGDKVVGTEGYRKNHTGTILEVIDETLNYEARYKVWFEGAIDSIFVDESSLKKPEVLLEMATMSGGFLSIRITVYGGEGAIPHYHFYKGVAPDQGVSSEKRMGGGCICIKEPKYFSHDTHSDTMNSKEIKGLIKFLGSPYPNKKDETVWQHLVTAWNEGNDEYAAQKVDPNIPIPPYTSNMESIMKR